MRRQCECGECCQKCGRPAATYAKPNPIVGSKSPPTAAEGWRELGPDEVIWRGDVFFGSEPAVDPPRIHRAEGARHVGHQPRGRGGLRYFRSTKYRIEDLPLAEWRKREGGDDRFDHLHPGQRVTTIYRADGSVLLRSGHPPDERASWTAEQIVAAIGGEQP
jgi:hypothetical protein